MRRADKPILYIMTAHVSRTSDGLGSGGRSPSAVRRSTVCVVLRRTRLGIRRARGSIESRGKGGFEGCGWSPWSAVPRSVNGSGRRTVRILKSLQEVDRGERVATVMRGLNLGRGSMLYGVMDGNLAVLFCTHISS